MYHSYKHVLGPPSDIRYERMRELQFIGRRLTYFWAAFAALNFSLRITASTSGRIDARRSAVV